MQQSLNIIISGAGTNLKAGTCVRREEPEKFSCRVPPLFGSTSTISRFGERFRDGHWTVQFGQFINQSIKLFYNAPKS